MSDILSGADHTRSAYESNQRGVLALRTHARAAISELLSADQLSKPHSEDPTNNQIGDIEDNIH